MSLSHVGKTGGIEAFVAGHRGPCCHLGPSRKFKVKWTLEFHEGFEEGRARMGPCLGSTIHREMLLQGLRTQQASSKS